MTNCQQATTDKTSINILEQLKSSSFSCVVLTKEQQPRAIAKHFGTFLIVGLLSIFSYSPAQAQTTFDPLTIGIGARALGMGGAYTAIAEDADAIFNNPAGLGEIDSMKFTSMAGTVLEEINYTVLGGIYPLGNRLATGLGYVGAYTSGIELRNNTGALLRRANFGSHLLLASCGKKFSDKFSLGINFKYFYNIGSEIDSGNGQGWNLDVGILQKGWDWLRFGLVGQNLLNSGKIIYQSGAAEQPATKIKAGANLYLMGSGFGAAKFAAQEINLSLETCLNLRQSKTLDLNYGLEYSPHSLLTIRTGFDQGLLTAGLTFKMAGLSFSYAYHTFSGFSGNTTNFFSISVDERGWPSEHPPDVFFGEVAKPISL
jgi:hypothetical protein